MKYGLELGENKLFSIEKGTYIWSARWVGSGIPSTQTCPTRNFFYPTLLALLWGQVQNST